MQDIYGNIESFGITSDFEGEFKWCCYLSALPQRTFGDQITVFIIHQTNKDNR